MGDLIFFSITVLRCVTKLLDLQVQFVKSIHNILKISFQIMVLEYKIPLLHEVNRSPTLQPFLWLVRRILITFSISYALVSFCMLTHDKYLQVREVYVSFVTSPNLDNVYRHTSVLFDGPQVSFWKLDFTKKKQILALDNLI